MRPRSLDRAIVYLWLMAGAALTSATPTTAHEGHAPLPTKGVEVDVAKGLLTLSPDAFRALGVQSAPVEPRILEERALAYATLVTPWQQQYFVSSPLSGRLAALHVATGDAVEAGQLLAEVASTELDALQLELRNASNELQLATRQVERLQGLVKSQAIPEREYLEAVSKREQGRGAVQIIRRKLHSVGIGDEQLDRLMADSSGSRLLLAPLVSPLRGVVSHTDLAIGKVIAANEHLFEVHDLTKLWVKIGVLERDAARIKSGQKVELEFAAFPRRPFRTVVSVPPVELDARTHVATAWAELGNSNEPPELLPGMYGTAKLVTSEPSKLLSVPASALLGTGGERYVLVEVAATSKGNEYRRQNVEVVAQNASYAQVRPGAVFPGDRVVTTGGQALSSFFVLGSLRLSKEGIRNIGLQVEPAEERVVEEVLSLDGTIDFPPARMASVSSQLAGKLVRVHVEPGAEVKAGQVLADVAGLPLQDTQLTMLKSAWEAKFLDESLERLQAPGSTSIVATRRIWETESARDAAINRRESARHTLLTMGMSAADVERVLRTGETQTALSIRAPIDGRIVRLAKVLGEGLAPEETLFEIHDLSQPYVKAFVAEGEALRVRVGTPVRVRLASDPSLAADGRVARSARTVDIDNRTLAVWVEFSQPPPRPLQRHLLVRISATLSQPVATLAIPWSAVVREQTRHYVFLQREGGLLERRSVELGRGDDRYVEVRRGLKRGERVAVRGTAELQTTYASIR